MTDTPSDIGTATAADLEGILSLQAANQTARGGMLSAELPRDRIEAMMREMPLVVARRGGRVCGFLMATTRTMNAELPVVRAMFAAYPGSADAYVYGPICVDPAERGQGLAAAMFAELRRLQPGREGVLFIRSDNEASLRAHRRMGMREVARFELSGAAFDVFSYVG
ncbi:GNAT family N-acetyltransferase [Variovorax sp. ZT5P49]|uniref:GNAT family N-acetyltransferase n=1 Tax=Variovorax sp. ZT5P49 TaxID=3443733 RepID=UPI003F46F1E0